MSFVRHMFSNYFLQVYGLTSYFLKCLLMTGLFMFFFFMVHAFWIVFKKPLPNPKLLRFSPMLPSESFVLLTLQNQVCDLFNDPNNTIYDVIFSCSYYCYFVHSTRWRAEVHSFVDGCPLRPWSLVVKILLPVEMAWHLSNTIVHICGSISALPILFRSSVFIAAAP
jgi:hypothetical protein